MNDFEIPARSALGYAALRRGRSRSGGRSGARMKNFTYQVEDNVAVLTLNIPDEPVNTLSPEAART